MNNHGFSVEELNYIENYIENRSKSSIIAWLLWFLIGTLGAHRFYLSKIWTGITMLVLSILGYLTTFILIGYVFLFIVGVWWLIDAFRINGWIRENKDQLRLEAIDNVLNTRAGRTSL